MSEVILYAEVTTKDGVKAAIVDPDTEWPETVPFVDWAATEYPFKMKLAFVDMTIQGIDYAARHPAFKRNIEIALSEALKVFIANGFEVGGHP